LIYGFQIGDEVGRVFIAEKELGHFEVRDVDSVIQIPLEALFRIPRENRPQRGRLWVGAVPRKSWRVAAGALVKSDLSSLDGIASGFWRVRRHTSGERH
jgi:hypothetical protein